MGLSYNNFALRGIDVSQFNGVIDWSKVAGTHFTSIRVGYGKTIDAKFKVNWAGAKGKVKRFPYWYIDFYSNHHVGSAAYGLSDEEFGKLQATICWNAIKNDPEGTVFADVENTAGVSWAPKITEVSGRAQAIVKAFLLEMDRLSGKRTGIYCSLGLLTWFAAWFKDRPLWVAWYNEAQTAATVLSAVRAAGWTGKCLMWQYASDGDLNDDGVADGVAMGMQYGFLDLNAWLGTPQEYAAMFGGPVPPTSEDETPPVVVPDEVDEDAGNYESYTVKINTLNLRSKPFVSTSTLIGKLFINLPLKIGKVVSIDGLVWGRVAVQGWWCCLKEGSQVYAEQV